jgi:hypothetical protein
MHMINKKILSRIYGHGRGYAFSGKDFLDLGDRDTVDKTLSLLAKNGNIRRLDRGMYDYPRQNPELGGQLAPDMDQVARAIARKLGIRIQPHGAWAANLLGLSTQVPAQIIYITDGHPKKYHILNQVIAFKRSAPGKFQSDDDMVSMIAGALRYLGQKSINDEMLSRLSRLLAGHSQKRILSEVQNLEGWIGDLI